jgi:hypothetical protein
MVLAAIALKFPGWHYVKGIFADGLTVEQEREKLLEEIENKVKKLVTDSNKDNAKQKDIDKQVEKLNKMVEKLDEEGKAALKTSCDDLVKKHGEMEALIQAQQQILVEQGTALKKLTEQDITKQKEGRSFRDAVKDAVMSLKEMIEEVPDKDAPGGKRLSLKEYLNRYKSSPSIKIDKALVDMFISNIAQAEVPKLRLTSLDPARVGIPLAIYPHVTDVMQTKTMTKPNMALLVVYEYEDGAGTKAEGTTSVKSSFKFKTVSFPCFVIATHFVMSDETLDDLEEALDEISIVGPDKIMDEVDSQVLGSAGDDASALAGLLTANKHTAFANAFANPVADADIIDVIASAKLQIENARYRPNVVWMSPEDISLVAGMRNTLEDSKTDRRVAYDSFGEPSFIYGLKVIKNTTLDENEMIVMDNRQPWIGIRKGMTMEIGYNGTDFVEGQKTVKLSVRLALGVRDKAGVVYVDDITAAVAAVEGGS